MPEEINRKLINSVSDPVHSYSISFLNQLYEGILPRKIIKSGNCERS